MSISKIPSLEGAPPKEGDGEGVRHFLGCIFRRFCPFCFIIQIFLSSQGPIFKFLSCLGHHFFICSL